MSPQVKAFLDMLAWAEIGPQLLKQSNNGYNVIVGSTPKNMSVFDDYADHPRRIVEVRPGLKSTAAGRYQIRSRIFDAYKDQLGLDDFGPKSQDRIALQLISECRALKDIEAGRVSIAIVKCASRWASLPGAGYGQHEHKISDLEAVFVVAGGRIA